MPVSKMYDVKMDTFTKQSGIFHSESPDGDTARGDRKPGFTSGEPGKSWG